jgi:hypothetical protein
MPRLIYDIQGSGVTDEVKDKVGYCIDKWLSERGLDPMQACYAWDHSDDVYHEEFHAAVAVASINGQERVHLTVSMYVDFE